MPYPKITSEEVKRIVDAHDPLKFLKMGAPSDEYEVEAAKIYMELVHTPSGSLTVESIRDLVDETFAIADSTPDARPIKMGYPHYLLLAHDIWKAL